MILKCEGGRSTFVTRAIQLYKVNVQIMVTLVPGNSIQGDDCFDVQLRGKKESSLPLFIVLTLLKACQKPFLNPVCQQESPTTSLIQICSIFILQGDKMYLKATNNHFIHLPPGVVYLTKLVIDIVVCFGSEFNFDICRQSTL